MKDLLAHALAWMLVFALAFVIREPALMMIPPKKPLNRRAFARDCGIAVAIVGGVGLVLFLVNR